LKPGNILVDSSGEPRVIHFGVARSTDSDLVTMTLQTNVGQLGGTLQYMSPEQCEPDPQEFDTRSDVYALGVVLYEMLCDRLPYDVSGVAFCEASQLIREGVPPRPSSINQTLRGDVETIILKAMDKDRDHRYQSAAELARDIRRYLANEPIRARLSSVTYQLRLFAQRHSALFGAATTIAAVLVIATVVSIVFAARARIAESKATEASQEAMHQRDVAITAESDARAAKAVSDRHRDAAIQQVPGRKRTPGWVHEGRRQAPGLPLVPQPQTQATGGGRTSPSVVCRAPGACAWELRRRSPQIWSSS
jgi:non-specific serine/threonine protein kinase/serine/threonine-protein kinase